MTREPGAGIVGWLPKVSGVQGQRAGGLGEMKPYAAIGSPESIQIQCI